MDTVPIQSLAVEHPPPSDALIRAVVTLSWPYSSSTKSCALLLADPDFTLRHRKGQVRVRFTGPSAEAVARAQIAIGDEVLLGLAGAAWAQDAAITRTPGRSVDGELAYSRRLELAVLKAGGEVKISVDEPVPPTSPERPSGNATATPVRRVANKARTSLGGGLGSIPIYSSPAFAKRLRQSMDSTHDALVDDDIEYEHVNKKQRISFGHVEQWRYAERSPSPVQDAVPEDLERADRGPAQEQSEVAHISRPSDAGGNTVQQSAEEGLHEALHGNGNNASRSGSMPPPARPPLQIPDTQPRLNVQETPCDSSGDDPGPSTPKLQPVSSSGLLLPSPSPSESTQQQHPASDAGAQHSWRETEPTPADLVAVATSVDLQPGNTNSALLIDDHHGARQATQDANEHRSVEYDRYQSNNGHDDHDIGGEVPGATQVLEPSEEFPSDTEPDINAYHDEDGNDGELSSAVEDKEYSARNSRLDDGVSDDSEGVLHESDVEEVIELSDLEGPLSDDDDRVEIDEDDHPTDASRPAGSPLRRPPEEKDQRSSEVVELDGRSESQPQTPAKPPPRDLGHDGPVTLVAPASQPQSTPQSEQDRIMARTYQSLFGFSTASELPQQPPQDVGTPTPAAKAGPSELPPGNWAVTGSLMGRTKVDDPRRSTLQAAAQDMHADTALSPSAIVSVRDADHTPDLSPNIESMDHERQAATDVSALEAPEESHDSNKTLTGQEMLPDVTESTHVPMADLPLEPEPETELHLQSMEMAHQRLAAAGLRSMGLPTATEAPTSPPAYADIPVDRELIREYHDHTHAEDDAFTDGQQHASSLGNPSPHYPAPEVIEIGSSSDGEAEVDVLPQTPIPTVDDLLYHTNAVAPVEEADDATASLVDEGDIMHETVFPTHVESVGDAMSIEPASEMDIPAVQAEADEVSDHALADVEVAPSLVIEDSQDELHEREMSTQPSYVEGDNLDESQRRERGDSAAAVELTLPAMTTVSEATSIETAQRDVPPEVIELGSSSPVTEVVIPESHRSPDDELIDDFIQVDQLSSHQRQGSVPASSEAEGASPMNEATLVGEETFSRPASDTDEVLATETLAYTTLHLSPPDSQQPPETIDPRLTQQSQPEAVASALPPTPQMTQREPEVQYSQNGSQHQQEQSEVQSSLDGAQDHYLEVEQGHDDRGQLGGTAVGPVTDSSLVEEASDETSRLDSTTAQETAHPFRRRVATRRSLRSRLSNVPDVISAWFSPKRSSAAAPVGAVSRHHPELERSSPSKGLERDHISLSGARNAFVDDGLKIPHSLSSQVDSRDSGMLTSLAYFTPLARIEEKLNRSSQQAYGADTTDILAVVTHSTKDPERAKAGPKDFFTIFRVTDTSMVKDVDTRVEVFRPWKATLPVADVGDVVLLRSFTVRSRNRQPYLLSTDASAWCVWRYADARIAGDQEGKPAWARKRADVGGVGVREEIKGPPVELGDEERQRARALYVQWASDRMYVGIPSENGPL